METKQIIKLVNISYKGNLATAELIQYFAPIAESKGLEHAGHSFQAWAVGLKLYPVKVLKTGKVVPMGWQSGLKTAREILDREPGNKLAQNHAMYCTVYNNIAYAVSSAKAKAKPESKGEGEGEGEGKGNLAESLLITMQNELRKLSSQLIAASVCKEAKISDFRALCEFTGKAIQAMIETADDETADDETADDETADETN